MQWLQLYNFNSTLTTLQTLKITVQLLLLYPGLPPAISLRKPLHPPPYRLIELCNLTGPLLLFKATTVDSSRHTVAYACPTKDDGTLVGRTPPEECPDVVPASPDSASSAP